jgi:hypothetical protein
MEKPEATVNFECDPLRYAEIWRRKTEVIPTSPWYSEREKAYFDIPQRLVIGGPQNREFAPQHSNTWKYVFDKMAMSAVREGHPNCDHDIVVSSGRGFSIVQAKHVRMAKKQVLRRIARVYYRSRISTPRPAIETSFTLRNRQEIDAFLRESPFLVSLALEARVQIKKYFPDSELTLETISDPEGLDPDTLFLYISTHDAPRDARPKLKALDREWWLTALERAKGKLCISLEYQ